ncbi:hypothetical protein AWW66_22300 [Micromonospora rosaria]|uniref:Uncharacterized protein n=1 Tax=Micromonospora rosaria TaxID=47874 RepID=A0A136PN63_9ACTN|nr:hypothetical protein [Micromonospora rosaria]KXK59808.1 hypothetical protein AWW66_22300 [Micromonospora rosaria]
MTTPTRSLDLTAALAQYRATLREVSNAELEHRAAAVAALPGWFAGELRRQVDEEREARRAAGPPSSARSWTPQVVVGAVVAGAPASVLAGQALAEYADRVPQALVWSPAVAVGLIAAVVGGGRLARWVDDHRHPLAEDVDEADLDQYGRELLARVRAARRARGEVC